MEIDYRYERKFRVEADEASVAEVLAAVQGLPALFRPAYPDRWVNSLYLDTPDRQAFHANAAGLAERAKPRIRWYGKTASVAPDAPARLEVKRRHGLVGTKELVPLPHWPPAPGRSAWPQYVRQHPWLRQHPELEPVVLISYLRTYLVSADGRFRLTLDRNLRYAPALPDLRATTPSAFITDPALVLELKYPLTAADDAPSLPFRLTRNSKYVLAVLNT